MKPIDVNEEQRRQREAWQRAGLNTASAGERIGRSQAAVVRDLHALWYVLAALAEFDPSCVEPYLMASTLAGSPSEARMRCGVNVADMARRLDMDRPGLYRRLNDGAEFLGELTRAGYAQAAISIGMEALLCGMAARYMERGSKATA